jgi:hypothetical protein
MLTTNLSSRVGYARAACALTIVLAASSLASKLVGIQFVDETVSRFPSPLLNEYTNQLTVGDLDGDGDLDLVFANGGNFTTAGTPQKLRVFINTGLNTGVFADETDARTGGLTFLARGAELGDIERDGDLDIIVAQDFNRQPTLLVNNGTGFFTNETNARLPIGTFSSTRAQFADVDNDGDLDLYLTNGGNVSRWGSGRGKLWLNDGSGVYSDATTTNTPNQNTSEPQDCIFADIDADFDLDIRIGSTASNQSKLYRNDGAGVFTQVATPPDSNCYSYDFGDINGDGDMDLIGANANASIGNAELELDNNGAGTYTIGAFTGASTDDNDSKFLDIDNDGDLDLVIASLGSTERVYTNNGTGTMTLAPGTITAVSDASLDIKVADVNGDGRYDLITAQGESGSFIDRIYMNNGPVDTLPPTIVRTEQVPDPDTIGGPYVVRTVIVDAHTSDRGFHDKGITLNWRNVSPLAGDPPFQAVPMDWSGNSLWRGVIPAQTTSGTVEYFVTAVDFNNNLGTGPTLSFTVTLPSCPADTDNSGAVDVDDLVAVILGWGECPAKGGCPADVDDSGVVDVDDLVAVILGWGACP